MVACPKCQGLIDVDEEDVDEGDTISCDECGADLRVVGTDPLELESRKISRKTKTRTIFWRMTRKKNPTRNGSNRMKTIWLVPADDFPPLCLRHVRPEEEGGKHPQRARHGDDRRRQPGQWRRGATEEHQDAANPVLHHEGGRHVSFFTI